MAIATSGKDILAKFYDEGEYQELYACADSAVISAFGSAGGAPVYAVCQTGAAMSAKDAAKMAKTLKLAAETGNPVVTFYQSAGAKLEDGLDAMAGARDVAQAVAKISGVVPQVAVVTGVCGASNALAAANADICIMSREAELFLSAPFTSAAAGDKLEGAGKADYAAKAGVAAMVVDNAQEAAVAAARLVALLPANNLSGAGVFNAAAPAGGYNLMKYQAKDAVAALADAGSVLALYEGCGNRVYTVLATVGGNVVGIAATEDAALCRESVSKLARFVRFCDAFSIPVVTVVNTEGFAASSTGDMAGGLREAARLSGTYGDATTALVNVITGKAQGAAYIAMAHADLTIAVDGCTIAPLAPEAMVTILNKEQIEQGNDIAGDTAKLAAQYAAQKCSAGAAVAMGLADFAVPAENLRATLIRSLDMLSTKRAQRMPKKHGNMAL